MPHPLWQSLATDAGQPLSDQQLSQLDKYIDLLIHWNEKFNLTRIVDKEDAQVKHVADALTLLQFLMPAEAPAALTLADVGTGGGVPGVPIAICRPDISVTLIDSTKKKLDAIQNMTEDIGLKNVKFLHARAETVKKQFDIVTARAVADLDTLLQWTWPIFKPTGVLLAMKGPKAQEELRLASRRLQYMKRSARIEQVKVEGLEGHCVVRVG